MNTNYNEWITPTRWHIDDVKMAIQNSDYKDKPMPSDEVLYNYLSRVLDNGYFIEVINDTIADQLYELFEELTYPLSIDGLTTDL